MISWPLGCLCLLALCISSARAEPSFYAGAAAGRLHLHSDFVGQVAEVHARDRAPPDDIRIASGRRIGGRVFGGFRLTPHFALEIDYVDLGEVATAYTTFGDFPITGPGTLISRSFTTFDHNAKVSGFGASAVASLPITQSFAILARAGTARLRSEVRGKVMTYHGLIDNLGRPGIGQANFVGGGAIDNDMRQTRAVLGVGLDFRVTERLRLRAMWDRYFGVGRAVERFTIEGHGKSDIDLVAVAIAFDF
jgi:hypothetical protein